VPRDRQGNDERTAFLPTCNGRAVFQVGVGVGISTCIPPLEPYKNGWKWSDDWMKGKLALISHVGFFSVTQVGRKQQGECRRFRRMEKGGFKITKPV